jgi:hypothetical protein
MLVIAYLFRCSGWVGTLRSGQVDKPVMGASNAGSYKVTPPDRRVHTTPPTETTNRPKDSNNRVRLAESQTQRAVPHLFSLAYDTVISGSCCGPAVSWGYRWSARAASVMAAATRSSAVVLRRHCRQ